MENKNQIVIVSLLALIVGLLLGYFFGANAMPNRGFSNNDSMHQEMMGHMHEDEMVDKDGSMRHQMDEMMASFKGLEGEAYEKMFLSEMIVHHVGAIDMAKGLLEQTDRPELIKLANDIIQSQSGEVEMMKGWLQMWFNEN